MKYDFDKIVDRVGTNSVKWDFMEKFAGVDSSCIPLWIADMDFECAKPIVDAVEKRAKHAVFGYSEKPDSYYESVINWMKKRHNWEITKESICVTPGIVKALNFIVQTYTNKGDGVIIQTPVYGPFMQAVEKNDRVIYENRLKYENEKYAIDFEDLEEKAKNPSVKLLILCSPHNPISRVWTKEELTRIGQICIDNNVIVVSDEIHSDIIYKGHKHIPFAAVSEEFANNSIICSAPSKTFNIAGLETSNIIICNEKIRQEYIKALDKNGIKGHNPFGIVATEAAYNEGEEWLDQVIEYLDENVKFVKEFLEEKIPNVKLVNPEGTFLLWLDCRGLGLNENELKTLLEKEAKIALDQGPNFGKAGIGFERLNIGCSRSIIESALIRLERAINK